MPTLEGYRTTKSYSPNTLARDLEEKVHLLEAEDAPFTAMLMKAQAKPTINPKFEHGEDDYVSPIVTVSGAHNSSVTAIQLAAGHAKLIVNGSQLLNSRTHELLLVSAVNKVTDIITVTRGHLSTTAAAMNNTDTLIIASESREEGVDFGSAISTELALDFNYTEEFETPVQATWKQMAQKQLTESDWNLQVRKAAVEHMRKMERAVWFSKRDLQASGPTGQRMYYTGGIFWKIKDDGTNVKNIGSSVLVAMDLYDWLQGIQSYGNPNRKVLFGSPFAWIRVSSLADGFVRIPRSETTLGLTIKQVSLNGHVMPFVENAMFQKVGFKDFLFCVDLDHVVLRYFAANGFNFKMKWYRNQEPKGFKGRKDVIHSDEGVQVRLAKAHGYLHGFV